ncbi:MAG: DNA polymerase/3'-5' exonuclease PolX [Actinomycetota bacterium]
MPRVNEEIEDLLTEWADLLQIGGADAFRVRAYEKAARALGGHPRDLRDLSDREILAIPSVGKHMAARVREYLDAGTMHELEDMREAVPAGVRDLMRVPGLGPKRALLLHQELGIAGIGELADAIASERVRAVKGLGEKTELNLFRALQNLSRTQDRVRIDEAIEISLRVVEQLENLPGVKSIVPAGSVRRMRDTIGDLDVLVASENSEHVMGAFLEMPDVVSVVARGDTKSSVVTRRGMQIDLRVVPANAWGAALIYFTGSKEHNVKIRELAMKAGMKLSEWGLFRACDGRLIAGATEEEVYAALGLAWIPPAMREDTGEVEAALAGDLPALIEQTDLRGDLHSHTDLTDGIASLDVMVEAAAARGFEYFAITDHAQNLAMTGMSREAVLAQREKIATIQLRFPHMRLLHGCELNIGRDGSVDYDAEFLAGFDITVASVHSLFRLSREETTARLIAAARNPFVNVIGHPTGRLIGRREPIDVDFEVLFGVAAETGTALEVNCFPDRLDLRDEHVRWATRRGVTISIATDAHAPKHLDNVRFGIGTAQRGWAKRSDVLNARTASEVGKFVADKRAPR